MPANDLDLIHWGTHSVNEVLYHILFVKYYISGSSHYYIEMLNRLVAS